MDVHSAYALASARRDDFAREAEESRVARLARECRKDEQSRPRPEPRAVRARRLSVAR